MLQSKLFTKTRKEAPKDEVSKNAELLIRGGFVSKEMAGAYNLLPLGLRVFNKIVGIIRKEMNAIGGQEVFMNSLQRPELWKKHFNESRWDEDVWFKTNFSDGGETGLAFTHEEPISNMMEQFVSSYKDLPFAVYQFQTKFRNEKRATSGVLRTREFVMKDMYSFSKSEEEHNKFYEEAKEAYKKIFNIVGIGEQTYLTKASGGSFSKFSHEFQTVTPAGEDTIFITDEEKREAINKEIGSPEDGREERAVEVGNIFTLGSRFSEPNLNFKDEKGEQGVVFMGSYGIGPARLMGTIVEVLSDEKGIIWPQSVSPFRAHLLLAIEDESAKEMADDLYEKLVSENIEVLYDDRDLRAGEKFADADLIGITSQVIVGKRAVESKLYELKERLSGEVRNLSFDDLVSELRK